MVQCPAGSQSYLKEQAAGFVESEQAEIARFGSNSTRGAVATIRTPPQPAGQTSRVQARCIGENLFFHDKGCPAMDACRWSLRDNMSGWRFFYMDP